MQKSAFTFLLPTALALLLAGCSTLEFPGVYRLTIEQGNIVTREMVAELEPGMSREQVEFVLGSPLLRDTFNHERWDYIFMEREGTDPMRQYRLSVFFDGDALSYFSGDFTPEPVPVDES